MSSRFGRVFREDMAGFEFCITLAIAIDWLRPIDFSWLGRQLQKPLSAVLEKLQSDCCFQRLKIPQRSKLSKQGEASEQ